MADAKSELTVRCSRNHGDTQHFVANDKTLCGRNASGWPVLDISAQMSAETAYCCERCQRAFLDGLKKLSSQPAQIEAATPHDPLVIAKSMTALRTRAGAAERCRKYIDGKIKSENPTSLWAAVLHHIENTNFAV